MVEKKTPLVLRHPVLATISKYHLLHMIIVVVVAVGCNNHYNDDILAWVCKNKGFDY